MFYFTSNHDRNLCSVLLLVLIVSFVRCAPLVQKLSKTQSGVAPMSAKVSNPDIASTSFLTRQIGNESTRHCAPHNPGHRSLQVSSRLHERPSFAPSQKTKKSNTPTEILGKNLSQKKCCCSDKCFSYKFVWDGRKYY